MSLSVWERIFRSQMTSFRDSKWTFSATIFSGFSPSIEETQEEEALEDKNGEWQPPRETFVGAGRTYKTAISTIDSSTT